MPLALALALTDGFLAFAAFIVFWVLMYRIVGIQPTAAERRRLRVRLPVLGILIALVAVAPASHLPGAVFYGLGLVFLAFLGARRLQQRGHWLMTLLPEEQAAVPARRAAFAAAKGKLWVLAAGFTLVFVVLEIGLVLATR